MAFAADGFHPECPANEDAAGDKNAPARRRRQPEQEGNEIEAARQQEWRGEDHPGETEESTQVPVRQRLHHQLMDPRLLVDREVNEDNAKHPPIA